MKNNPYILALAALGAGVAIFGALGLTRAQDALQFDLNNDGRVDEVDLAIFHTDFKAGVYDALDYAAFARDYGLSEIPDDESDYDNDKYTIADGDCDDRDSTINPTAKEMCDNIDNNCNTIVDDLCDYKPIRSLEYYEISIPWSIVDGIEILDENNISIASGTYSEERISTSSTGNYAINIMNANQDIIDGVLFDLPKEVRNFGEEGDSVPSHHVEVAVNEGLITLQISKNSEVAQFQIVSTENPDLNIVRSFAGLSSIVPDANASHTQTFDCPDALKGDGIHFTIYNCFNFDEDEHPENQAAVQGIIDAFTNIKKFTPELNYLPLLDISIEDHQGIIEECNGTINPDGTTGTKGCADSFGIFLRNDLSSESIENVLVHEFAHRFRNFSFVNLENLSEASRVYYKGQLDDLARFINEKRSDAGNCFFDHRLFKLNWLADNGGLKNEFIETEPPHSWLESKIIHPPSGSIDPSGPRAGDPGSVSAYGARDEDEKFAELYVTIFLEEKDGFPTDVLQNLCTIIYDFNPDPSTPEITHKKFTDDLKILGFNCLIEDFDHDGVPDKCDNCAPLIACSEDAENGYESCSNPDQRDEVDSEHETPENRDPLGDRCEEGRIMTFCGGLPGAGPWEDYDAVPEQYKNRVRWVTREYAEDQGVCLGLLMGSLYYVDAETIGEAGCALPGLSNGVEAPLGAAGTCPRGGNPKYSRSDGPCGGIIGTYCERDVAGRCSYTGSICKKNEDCQELENTENTCGNFSIDANYSVHGANNYE